MSAFPGVSSYQSSSLGSKFVVIGVVCCQEMRRNALFHKVLPVLTKYLSELYSAYTPIMCSYATVPYSKISYKSNEEQVASWIIESMELKENIRYFFNCKGTWVGIKFLNLHEGVNSLWKHQGLGFMLASNDLTQIMEASFDSRDEDNYLIDIWNYKS